MPEYVYALHDFTPQVADEIEFKVGDRIEVVEKDDMYGDGWWQGRNPAGQTGLFPQSYTSPTPPSSSSVTFPDQSPADPSPSIEPTSSTLHTLPEESESVAGNGDSRQSPSPSERRRTPSEGDVMMRATLTDVQRAIEQLGRNDRDGARSFSFASSRGDYSERSETETEDEHDADVEDELGWHKDARTKLAERAKRENEQRQAREAEEQPRAMIPPIDVEVSDESDADDEDSPASPRRQPQYPRISEEEEDAEESTAKESPEGKSSNDSIVPSDKYLILDETDLPTATALTFPEPSPVPSSLTLSTPTNPPVEITEPTPAEAAATPEPAPAADLEPEPSTISSLHPASVPMPASPITLETPVQAMAPIITPTPSTIKVAEQPALPSPSASSTGSYAVSSTAGIQQSLSPATTMASLSTPHQSGTDTPDLAKKLSNPPSEWGVDEVVEWLKSKGFDQGVCDKFIEQEITGDVLLELNAEILKSEIGIVAFGKRARIVNAIAELRRPPSMEEPEPQPGHMLTPRSLTHSFQYPGSHHSAPSHSHTHSMASSAQQSFNNSPFAPSSPSVANGFPSAGLGPMTSPESPPHTGDLSSPMSRNGWRASDPGSIHGSMVNLDEDNRGRALAGLGLGLPGPKGTKGRPSQLVLSPSDSALGETVAAIQDSERTSESVKDERAVMSESESIRGKDPKSRRRLFGRSSGSLKDKDNASNHSAGTSLNSPLPSSSPVDDSAPVRRRSKSTKSIDERKASDRLSLFGSSFTGTLGKHRKPAPKLLNVGEKSESSDKHHLGTFSRLREKRSSSRPGTSEGTVKHPTEKEKEKSKSKDAFPKEKDKKDRTLSISPSFKERDPALLRKRTSSTSDHPTRPSLAVTQATGGPNLKAGQSILEQIGTPDHNGWLRKKGERYNSWKLRYFVLKGPHLYWLRSNSKSETKIKGYLNIVGYKVLADENADPGRYGFRIVHDNDKPHSFSSEEQLVVREWMKALMKATITRDYTNPVMSSCNIPTIPLTVAQAMNPAPRPPSPTAREATQKAMRRENPHQLSSRDAQVLLMGMPNKEPNGERARLESFFTNDTVSTNEPESPVAMKTKKAVSPKSPVPPRPSRELRRISTAASQQMSGEHDAPVDDTLIEWANSHLPRNLRIKDTAGPLCGGLALLRLAEDIKGKPSSPPVPDAAFPSGPHDDKLDGLFRLFDYLLDNDVKMGTVSINDIRQGKREKIIQLLRALKAWEERRKAIAESVGRGAVAAGPFMGMAGPLNY
ncbi:hypothetical protein K466DRAFT_579615 [Polyporus arcularius HHB13444]|uniref:PH-domain-containing protein n=1 Tax=Polyporus arcularius HHB13444 TaxID=1314778 RepID=A0A5C3PZF7_9APHY|nr:hypothetical protein K466DRAFT_579615 [Polyporus arcularius HHB13444]